MCPMNFLIHVGQSTMMQFLNDLTQTQLYSYRLITPTVVRGVCLPNDLLCYLNALSSTVSCQLYLLASFYPPLYTVNRVGQSSIMWWWKSLYHPGVKSSKVNDMVLKVALLSRFKSSKVNRVMWMASTIQGSEFKGQWCGVERASTIQGSHLLPSRNSSFVNLPSWF